MRRAIGGWAAVLAGGLLAAGCSGFSGSGTGFGGFGRAPSPAVSEDSYTQRRMTGAPDEIAPLQPDSSVQWPRDSGERASVFETEEDRRARERRESQVRRPPGSPAPGPLPPR